MVRVADVQDSTLRRLLNDPIFIDFFNKFMCIPIFAIKCVWQNDKFHVYPELDESNSKFNETGVQEKIFHWVLQERLPFFFQSPIYVEYQLCKLLTTAQLFDEEHTDLIEIQRRYLSSMTSMYRFKRWLKKFSYVGILCLTYWMDAQAALVCHYRGMNPEDAQMLLLEMKDKYYEKHSQFCLPDPILSHSNQVSKTAPEYTVTVQAKVLRHLQYYYMPEFLLAHKHELINTAGDSSPRREEDFVKTLRTFVNRSFQNCNLVYSIKSKTTLLSARHSTSSHVRERVSLDIKEPAFTENGGGAPALRSDGGTSVTIKASDIMVVYHMEYKGQLSNQDEQLPMIGEDSVESVNTEEISNIRKRVDINVRQPSCEPSTLGVDRVGSMIYQSRSLFARGSSVHHMNKGTTFKEERITDQPVVTTKRSTLSTKQMLMDTEIQQRKNSTLSMPYNTTNQRKQSMVQRRMSRKMTMRRNTLFQGPRQTQIDGMGGPSVRPSAINPAALPTIENESETVLSEEPSTEAIVVDQNQSNAENRGFVRTIKNRLAVAKAVRKLKVKARSRRSTNPIEKTVRIHFRMNDAGTELKAKSTSSNTRFSQMDLANQRVCSLFNQQENALAEEEFNNSVHDSETNRHKTPLATRESELKSRTSDLKTKGSTTKNTLALFKLKGMAKRARQNTIGLDKRDSSTAACNRPTSILKRAVKGKRDSTDSMARTSEQSLTDSANQQSDRTGSNKSSETKLDADENEGATRRRGRGMSLSIYSTASNSNQRGAKCTKTNLKMPKLLTIDTLNEDDGSEMGSIGSQRGLESVTDLTAMQAREDTIPLGGAATTNKKKKKKKTVLLTTEADLGKGKGSAKTGNATTPKNSLTPTQSAHRKQSLSRVRSQASEMHQKKTRTKSCFGRHMLDKIELEKRFQKFDVKKIVMDHVDTSLGINESVVKKMAVDDMILLQRRSHAPIQALLSDRLSGGIFFHYLTKSASFDQRSILCLNYIQDLQMFEDCFPLLDRLQVSAAFEAILLKNVPTSMTILNELPGIRSHWNYLLQELHGDNSWLQVPWRLYAIKVDAMKLLLVEYHRFVKANRLFFLSEINEVAQKDACTVHSSVSMYRASQLQLQSKPQYNQPSESRFREKYRVVWKERPQDEPESGLDSDEENEIHNAGVEKIKREAVKEQLMSSLPIGQRKRFRNRRVTNHHVFSQLVYFFGKDITLSCFSILSTDDDIPQVLLQQEKAFLNHQPLPTNELASHSLVQYPNLDDPEQMGGMDGMGGVSARIVEKQKHKPIYMCSIRKNGHVLRRPEKRPANFLEVLRDPRHYEFFARYLKAMNCEGPLLFWKSVEHLKSIPEAAKRSIKIKAILKKYFAWSANQTRTIVRLAATINMLNCNADIIRDIIDLDIESVNVSLLVAAQTAVQRSMEKAWETRYYKTFPDAETEDCGRLTRHGRIQDIMLETGEEDTKYVQPSSNAWRVFTLFIKRSAMFIKAMKIPALQEEFRQYLKDYANSRRSVTQRKLLDGGNLAKYNTLSCDHREKEMAYEIPSRASSVCKIYPYHLYDPDDKRMNLMSMKFEMVCGKNVYPDLLVNDLDFWLEVQLYQDMIDCWTCRQDATQSRVCNNHIRDKVHLITDIYLHSHIPPKVRVNADHELARTIQMYSINMSNAVSNVNRGYKEIDRSIFHEIVLQIFPVLIKHWSAFCHNKFRYVSKQSKARIRQEEAQIKHRQLQARRQRRMIRTIKKHAHPGASQLSTPCTTAATLHSGAGDFATVPPPTPVKAMKGLRIENSLMIDQPIMKFSVSGGGASWLSPTAPEKVQHNSYVSVTARRSLERAPHRRTQNSN